jgi:hypothetical protein
MERITIFERISAAGRGTSRFTPKANWPGFPPPRWPGFTPPLTNIDPLLAELDSVLVRHKPRAVELLWASGFLTHRALTAITDEAARKFYMESFILNLRMGIGDAEAPNRKHLN